MKQPVIGATVQVKGAASGDYYRLEREIHLES